MEGAGGFSAGYVITRPGAAHFLTTAPRMVHSIDHALLCYWESGLNVFYIDPPATEAKSSLCGTRVVLAAPDRDTAPWSADSLGRSEVEEVADGFSYGANTIRDGVSLTPRRELRALALPSRRQLNTSLVFTS